MDNAAVLNIAAEAIRVSIKRAADNPNFGVCPGPNVSEAEAQAYAEMSQQWLSDRMTALGRIERLTVRPDPLEPTEATMVIGNMAFTPEDSLIRVDLRGFGASGRQWLCAYERAKLLRFLLPPVTAEEFTETTDSFGGGIEECCAGMQFIAKVGDGSRHGANLCLHYDAPGYISDIELPDRITVEELEAYAAVFSAADWYREYSKTAEEATSV